MYRTFYKKCEDITPPNLFQTLQQAQENSPEECSLSQNKNALGDGELGKEYARVVEMRQKISEELHAECIEKDIKLAAAILEAERLAEEERYREQEEIARRDAEYALKLTSSQSPVKEKKASLKRPREITSFLTGNSTKIVADATPGISVWLSGRGHRKSSSTKLPNTTINNNAKYPGSILLHSREDALSTTNVTPSCTSPPMSQGASSSFINSIRFVTYY